MGAFKLSIYENGKLLKTASFDQNVVTIGRSPTADFSIDGMYLSRMQAELLRTSQGFALFAHPSPNVTRVRGQPVPSEQSVPISPGDPVRLSDTYDFALELLPAEGTVPPVAAQPKAAEPAPRPPRESPVTARVPALPEKKPGPPSGRLTPAPGPRPTPTPTPKPLPKPQPAVDQGAPWWEQHRPQAPSAPRDAPTAAAPEAAPAAPPVVELAPAAPAAPAAPGVGVSAAQVPVAPPVKVEVLASARQRQGPPGARLRCQLNGTERTLDVHDDLYIGGGEDSDLRLSGAYAPRRAALLVRVDGAYRLYNTSPLAETVLVNRKGIEGHTNLADGDDISVYGTSLTFEVVRGL